MGSLDYNARSVEKDEDIFRREWRNWSVSDLLRWDQRRKYHDEEAAKKSLVFSTEIKVTKAKKEGNNQNNIKESDIEMRKILVLVER